MGKRFDEVVRLFALKSPGFEVTFKDESWLMKLIGMILFFNPRFMTSFITTIGKTIYFPSKAHLEEVPESSNVGVLCHEYMHIRDYDRWSIWFFLAYMFPLTLLPLAIAMLFVYWPVALVLIALCLAPLPSPGRMYFELRGYIMSLYTYDILAKEVGISEQGRTEDMLQMVDFFNTQFTGLSYYLMWPFGVKKQLNDAVKLILSDMLEETDGIYGEVAEVLVATKPQ